MVVCLTFESRLGITKGVGTDRAALPVLGQLVIVRPPLWECSSGYFNLSPG